MAERSVPLLPAWLRALPARLLALPIIVYRYGISPVIGPRCRFHPTCSAYGLDALRRFGALRGGWLVAARLARCHPWHPGGVDPLPEAFEPPGRHLARAWRDTAIRRGAAGAACPCEPPRPAREARRSSPSGS